MCGPLPEEAMAKLCASTRADDDNSPLYPDVDDFAELKVGTVVFVTATLTKASDATEKMKYALPGITHADEEGKLSIKLCPTKLWEQGWEEIKTVTLEDATHVRFCSRVEELGDDHLIIHFYEDDIGEAVESCGDKLIKDSPGFKAWIGGVITSDKFNLQRWTFMRAVTVKMASTMSIAEWRKNRPTCFDNEHPKESLAGEDPQVTWLDTDFISPVLADNTSGMESEPEKTKFKTSVCPKKGTVAKYLTRLMDIMTSDEGPSPSKKSKTSTDIAGKSDMKALTAQVVDLQAIVATLNRTMTSSFNAIATQLKVRADPKKDSNAAEVAKPDDAKPAEAQVVIVEVSGSEHECAYHVMSVAKAISDGTTQPSEKPTFSDTAVDAARAALLLQAKLAHEKDPESFEVTMDNTTIEELCKQVVAAEQGEKTWPGEPHFSLYAAVHPNVELKLKTFRAGTLCTISTRQEHLPPAKLVMFAKWRPGHFDIMGFEQNGLTKIAFTKKEVVVAELAFDELLLKGEAPVMSKLGNEEFNSVVVAALAANRASKKAAIAAGSRAVHGSGPRPVAAASAAAGAGSARGPAMPKPKSVSWNHNLSQVARIEVLDDEDQDVTAASLASFAQEEMVRRMQAQMDAQSKQMQAQAQLTLQSRQQVAALEAQLQAQKAGGLQQPQGGKSASVKPQQQPASSTSSVQQQGPSALDMILNGPATGQAGVQPALVIWGDSGKKKIEQALRIVDSAAFKGVHSMTKMDAGTSNARFIVLAFARDVAVVQTLLLPLAAAGMRVEFYDSVAPSSPPAWSTVAVGNKPKTSKNSKLAGQAQAGLSKAIAKAGPAGTTKRVHGQCDYFSAKLKCPRDSACRFTCYNGPGEP